MNQKLQCGKLYWICYNQIITQNGELLPKKLATELLLIDAYSNGRYKCFDMGWDCSWLLDEKDIVQFELVTEPSWGLQS